MSGTAEVHPNATLVPSKLDLLEQWLPQQDWFAGDPADLTRVAGYRFVDPDGEVGLDGLLIASQGTVYHVPVTWRAAELPEGDLIGTLEHSELGTRYGYDAPSDPVFVTELLRVIREGDTAADIVPAGTNEVRTPSIEVAGSGVVQGVDDQGQVRLVRVLDGSHADTHTARGVLVGQWNHEGSDREDVLAVLH